MIEAATPISVAVAWPAFLQTIWQPQIAVNSFVDQHRARQRPL